jgi:hypothetical protein
MIFFMGISFRVRGLVTRALAGHVDVRKPSAMTGAANAVEAMTRAIASTIFFITVLL